MGGGERGSRGEIPSVLLKKIEEDRKDDKAHHSYPDTGSDVTDSWPSEIQFTYLFMVCKYTLHTII